MTHVCESGNTTIYLGCTATFSLCSNCICAESKWWETENKWCTRCKCATRKTDQSSGRRTVSGQMGVRRNAHSRWYEHKVVTCVLIFRGRRMQHKALLLGAGWGVKSSWLPRQAAIVRPPSPPPQLSEPGAMVNSHTGHWASVQGLMGHRNSHCIYRKVCVPDNMHGSNTHRGRFVSKCIRMLKNNIHTKHPCYI